MKRRTFLIIVVLTGLALCGIIFIQVFWIRNAVALQEEQFDNRAILSLKSVVNEMYECRNDTCENSLFWKEGCSHSHSHHKVSINRLYLDSLIHAEFKSMGLREPYVYGIFNTETRKVSLISDTTFKNELINSDHAVSLSCIYRSSDTQLGAFFPDEGQRALLNIMWWLILCFVLILLLVFGFSYTIYSFLKQKKLSEMKTDFVNNMTHEFKTPIATISLASEMLLKPAVIASEEKARKYAGIIYDENQRLRNQVEHVLQISVLDREEFRLRKQETDIHQMIEELAEPFRMHVKERDGDIRLNLSATSAKAFVDTMHIRNVLSNLLDNACKYSPQQPSILIETISNRDGIIVAVEDKGMGISHENHKHVFRKLYRVSTGNVHDVRGFGLGLYYVKTMIEAHGGWIKLKSELRKGSRFEMFIPFGFSNTGTHGNSGE